MAGDLGTYIVFALGIIVGGVLFSKDFRVKFFKGLRKFLSGISSGAQNLNRNYGDRTTRRDEKVIYQEPTNNIKTVHHIHEDRIGCPQCKGSGKIKRRLPLIAGASAEYGRAEVCDMCGGKGWVIK